MNKNQKYTAEYIFSIKNDPLKTEKILQILYKALKRNSEKIKGGTKNDEARPLEASSRLY
ncbi:MAG: hypothetical protein PWQ16_808 [bacterium]|jgi:hypothetical protein|nr:hypothetical protein [bacterium]